MFDMITTLVLEPLYYSALCKVHSVHFEATVLIQACFTCESFLIEAGDVPLYTSNPHTLTVNGLQINSLCSFFYFFLTTVVICKWDFGFNMII